MLPLHMVIRKPDHGCVSLPLCIWVEMYVWRTMPAWSITTSPRTTSLAGMTRAACPSRSTVAWRGVLDLRRASARFARHSVRISAFGDNSQTQAQHDMSDWVRHGC